MSVPPYLTRRGALQWSAAAVLGPSVLRAAGRGAAPAVADPKIVLTFQPWQYAYGFQSLSSLNAILYQGTEPFRAAHPSIELQFFGPEINPYTSVMAGQGPDVPQLQGGGGGITDWISGPLGTLLLDLSPYIRAANINLNDFNQDNILDVSYQGGVYGLPNYTGTAAMAVNLTVLDELGLPYPSPDWTYLEWEHLSRASSTRLPNGTRRLGTTMTPSFGPGPDAYIYHGWGGAQQDPTNPAVCVMDSPQDVAAAEFLYQMQFDNVLAWEWVPSNFVQGLTVIPFCWQQTYMIPAATSWRGFRWDFWPQPAWPKRRATFTNYNYFGIAANTKYPEAAWELVYWLTVQPDWQRLLMRTVLLSPGYLPLWPEYVEVVRSVAPSLRDKNLEVFAQQVPDAIIHGGRHFANSEVQVQQLIGNWYTQISNRQVSVRDGLVQLSRQINALEKAGNREVASQEAAVAAERRALAAVAVGPTSHYAAPPVQGVGVPPSDATPWVVVGPSGTYTLLGDGWDVYATSDNAVFACLPVTATEGEWSARVTVLTNLTCPHLSQWAKVGIGAFGDLSDDAPYCSPHVTGANQIEWQYRAVPTLYPDGAAGLLPAGTKNLTLPNTKPAANYLVQPVWLKLSRQGDLWTPWASLDGTHWTQLNPPATVFMAGCWVGIFACAHNGSFNNKGYIRATFDHLSFVPTRFVQMGRTGTPPAAGAVPKDWATMAPAGA
jgi:ABC-type glycerol-3-phosphate transport system substrate-binding protein